MLTCPKCGCEVSTSEHHAAKQLGRSLLFDEGASCGDSIPGVCPMCGWSKGIREREDEYEDENENEEMDVV